MGIQFAIHTYGHFDAMFYVLNGIKMIMNHDFTDAMIKLMAVITTSYYALLGMAGASDGRVSTYFLKTAGMLLVITALLTPKADMLVIDRVSGKKEIVSNLPYAFVLPVGALEAFGAGITSLFEQAFSTVSGAPYKDYGMIFGQRIVQEAKNWKIANPEFARNMDVYLSRCVVLEAMIGTRFNPEDVKSSNDLWRLVTENAGTFRKVDFRMNKVQTKLTCKEAGNVLKSYFGSELGFLNYKYKKSDFSVAGGNGAARLGVSADATKLNSLLARNIEIGYSNALGVESKAEDIIRQNMMINSLKSFNNKSDLYGYTRAASTQNSNWAISGELAKEYLPLLLNIIKALIYASFIFIVPLMILGGGVDKYLKYCIVVFSLQIWPALNSILNLFIELYSHANGEGITAGSITYGNFNQAHQAVDTIVLVASGLQMSIPFLSFAIVQGGVQSFVHLAGSVQSASSGAAASAAQEVTSGARTFDNKSLGSQSIDNKSGFKTDFNQSFQEGANQVQLSSGAMQRVFADGNSAINSGSNIDMSSGSRKFGLDTSTQAGYQQSLSNTLSSLKGEEQNFNNAKTATINSASDLVSHIAKRESAGEFFNYESMGEQGKALNQAVNHTKTLHDQNGYGWDQAAGASVKAYANLGIKSPIPGFKASTGVATDGSVSASNTSTQSLTEGEQASRSNDTQASFNNLVKAAQNENWMKENSIDTSFAHSTRANYDQMQSYQQSMSHKREEAESYSAALQYSHNNGASDNRDMYHEVEKGIMQAYGVSQREAHQMIESHDPRADKVWSEIVNQNMHHVMDKVTTGREYIDHSASSHANAFHDTHASKVSDQGVNGLVNTAREQGLSMDETQTNLSGAKASLAAENTAVTQTNKNQITSVEHYNTTMEQGMQNRANKYEEDRIGQGKTAVTAGFLSNIATLWNGGELNLGGPTSKDKVQANLKAIQPPLQNNGKSND